MTAPIGFAIIGAGSIAETHANAIAESPDAELVAVHSRNAENCRAFAAKHSARAAADLGELVRDPAIQAVCITTPSGAHAEAAVAMLQASKAVLCEKPLEITLEACDRILAAERQHGGLLAAVFQLRLGQGAQQLKSAIEAGRFGRLTLCSAYLKWWRDQNYYRSSAWKGTWALDGGGALMNQGVHAVDLLQWFAGMPAEVSAFSDTLAHPGVEAEDTLAGVVRFPHGALGVIEAATSTFPGSDLRIEIAGDRGSATLVNDRITRWDFAEPQAGDAELLAASQSKLSSGASDPRLASSAGHRALITDLAQAVRFGKKPLISGAEARRSVQLICALYESARTRRAVSLS